MSVDPISGAACDEGAKRDTSEMKLILIFLTACNYEKNTLYLFKF